MEQICCKDYKPIESDGYTVCECCGTIGEKLIDDGAEWRYYGSEDKRDDPTRCGKPVNELLPESSQGSTVLGGGGMNKEMRKMVQYINWNSMPARERSQYQVFEYIQNVGTVYGLNKAILQDAIWFYKKLTDECAARGHNKDGQIGSAVYLACKRHGFPMTTQEISDMFQFSAGSMAKGCRKANQIMTDLKIEQKTEESTALDFVERLCSNLQMNMENTKLCQFCAFRWNKLALDIENTPKSIAAAIVMMVIEDRSLPITKKSVAEHSGLSVVSITKCVNKLYVYKKDLIPVSKA